MFCNNFAQIFVHFSKGVVAGLVVFSPDLQKFTSDIAEIDLFLQGQSFRRVQFVEIVDDGKPGILRELSPLILFQFLRIAPLAVLLNLKVQTLTAGFEELAVVAAYLEAAQLQEVGL
jgi:hypothetical protein